MQLLENISLKPYNTFGVEATARYFVSIRSVDELTDLVRNGITRDKPVLILGGGSNVLFKKPFNGLVVHPDFPGIDTLRSEDHTVRVRMGSGLNWDSVVKKTVESGLFGLENLSLIPGNVGAGPVQNIGAYGTELKDVFASLEATNLITGEHRTFDREACQFGYRNSWFKSQSEPWLISSVSLTLSTQFTPNLRYAELESALSEAGIQTPTAEDVRREVIKLRTGKLPDPAKIGNAGSFFKNPVISGALHESLTAKYGKIPTHEAGPDQWKLSAAWLIEQCGWRGKNIGACGVYEKHALILVNHGGATGEELRQLSLEIQLSVREKFGIELEPEVKIIEG